jgi:hypothetical protein
MLPHKNYPTGLYIIKAFKIDKGNDSLHSIGGILLIGQVLRFSVSDTLRFSVSDTLILNYKLFKMIQLQK